ncbi:MAG: acetyl-CoA carboxylase biotin carboxyl carrier protein subunit [Betaproteobacteria bacterium]|nr:acetyl-CoA carboxylase biotin carboxyl carrier protein subunit [Betaproteobacteria bacterium]
MPKGERILAYRRHGPSGCLAYSRIGVGDRVDQGQTLMHIEAMKMQHHIAAPQQGLVADVMVQAGQQVAAGQSLMRIEASD